MKLLDTCLLSLSAAAFIIGVHQIITIGFAQGYWLIMLSSVLFLWFSVRKKRTPPTEVPSPVKKKSRKQPRKKKKRAG